MHPQSRNALGLLVIGAVVAAWVLADAILSWLYEMRQIVATAAICLPLLIVLARAKTAGIWMVEQWAMRDLPREQVEKEALRLAGMAMLGVAILESSFSSEAVMLAVRRGWIVRDGKLLNQPTLHSHINASVYPCPEEVL